MYCKSCGKQNPENARFCRSCGTKIDNNIDPVRESDERPNTTKRYTKILFFSGIILSCCFIVGLVISTNSENKGNNYIEPDSVYLDTICCVDSDSIKEDHEVADDTTYLYVSENNVIFDSNGGYFDIEISTDEDWEIGTPPYDWISITKNSKSIRLSVESYNGDEDKTDWFTIKAGNNEKKINITQRAEWTRCTNCDGRGKTNCLCHNGYKSCSHCNNGYAQCTNNNYIGIYDNLGQFGHGKNMPVYTYDPWTGIQIISSYRLEICPTCGGTYRVKCSYCDGRGKIKCLSCDGNGERECSLCKGSGKVKKAY